MSVMVGVGHRGRIAVAADSRWVGGWNHQANVLPKVARGGHSLKRLLKLIGAIIVLGWGAWAAYYIALHAHDRANLDDPRVWLCVGGLSALCLYAVDRAPVWLFTAFDAIDALWRKIPE